MEIESPNLSLCSVMDDLWRKKGHDLKMTVYKVTVLIVIVVVMVYNFSFDFNDGVQGGANGADAGPD